MPLTSRHHALKKMGKNKDRVKFKAACVHDNMYIKYEKHLNFD